MPHKNTKMQGDRCGEITGLARARAEICLEFQSLAVDGPVELLQSPLGLHTITVVKICHGVTIMDTAIRVEGR